MTKAKVKRGLQSKHWHSQPASFAQTSRLAKETGKSIDQAKLCTWEVGLTKKSASDMISRCIAGERGEVRAELIQMGAVLWVKDTAKATTKPKAAAQKPVKSAPKVKAHPRQTKADLIDVNNALLAQIAEFKAQQQEVA